MNREYKDKEQLNLTSELRRIAAQENNDSEEYNLMQKAAEHIEFLEKRIVVLEDKVTKSQVSFL